MANQPDARRTGRRAYGLHPSVGIGYIIGNDHRVGVINRSGAAEHTTFVDAHRIDALMKEPFCQQAVAGCPQAKRIIPVPVGRTGPRNDQGNRSQRARRAKQCAG